MFCIVFFWRNDILRAVVQKCPNIFGPMKNVIADPPPQTWPPLRPVEVGDVVMANDDDVSWLRNLPMM
jgi:hypothetical protein